MISDAEYYLTGLNYCSNQLDISLFADIDSVANGGLGTV